MEAPASADRRTILPGRASDPGGPDLPVGDYGRGDDRFGTPGEWEELEEIVLRPRGGRAGPTLRLYFPLPFV